MSRRFHFHHVVTLDETNVVGNVYFAHYVKWQGWCRELFLAEHAPGVCRSLVAGELALITTDCSMTYMSQCFAYDQLDVAMALSCAHTSRLGMSFEVSRDGAIVARGTQHVVAMQATDRGLAPVPLPDELRRALDRFRS